MIQGLHVNVVRTKYDWDTYIPDNYKRQYTYEQSKATLPWLVVSPEKVDSNDGILPLQCNMAFSPTPDFTNLVEVAECKVSADGKYCEVDFTNCNHLLMAVNSEIYPDNTFDGNTEVTLFTGTLEAPTAKVSFKLAELDVNEAQALIALFFNQQGQSQVGDLLNTIATKVYGVTYNTPPIEE